MTVATESVVILSGVVTMQKGDHLLDICSEEWSVEISVVAREVVIVKMKRRCSGN